MKRENSIVPRLITVVLGLLLCAYIGYQLYRSFYNPVETANAVYVEVDDSVRAEGYVVRDESTLIKNYGSGVLEIELYEGEKVKNGNAVAVIYADEASAKKKREETELSEEISRLTMLYAQSNESYDIEAANSRIAESAVDVVQLQYSGDFEDLESKVEELKFRTLMREYIYRDKSELLDVIEDLKVQRSAVASKISVKNRIYSPSAGYFSKNTDGYENVLNSDFVLNTTASEFEAMSGGEAFPAENSIGKIISNNKWYFAAVVDEKTGERFKTGLNVGLKFEDKHLPDVKAELVRKTEPENGKVLLVFMCDTNIDNFTKARKVTADIVVKTYSGLKVPREALRVSEDGTNGVYCLIDSQVKFKPINIIFEKGNYYISEYDSSNTKSLLLYDEIVISAKELENKKIIK